MELIKRIDLPYGFTIRIHPDSDAQNPRKDMDNICTVAIHPNCKYDIGDKDGWSKLQDVITSNENFRDEWVEPDGEDLDFDCIKDVETMLERCNAIHWLSVYMYDHSGISVSTGGFSCGWDSGKIGFIFVESARAIEEMNLTEGFVDEERIVIVLDNEIKILDQYCTGNVYGYQLTDPDGEEVDSCWGFYGLDDCIQQSHENVEHYTKAWLSKLGEPTLLMNTHVQVDLVSSVALEHAVGMVSHPFFESYEVFPGKGIELNFKMHVYDDNEKYLGVECATFRCQMLKRAYVGYKNGVPLQWDEFCCMLQQFALKGITHPDGKKKRESPEFWWDIFMVVMADIRANIPEAVYDTGTETWWIGDKGFNTTVGLPVTR